MVVSPDTPRHTDTKGLEPVSTDTETRLTSRVFALMCALDKANRLIDSLDNEYDELLQKHHILLRESVRGSMYVLASTEKQDG